MDRKTRRTEQTRREIREAAARLFFERGFREVTMADIGREVGLSAGSLYYYFPNKEEILREIDSECLKRSETVFESLAGAGQDLETTVLGFLKAVYAFAREHREYFLFLTRMVSSVDPDLLERITENRLGLYETLRKRLSALMRAYQQRGEARRDVEPEDLGQMLAGLAHALMFAWFLGAYRDEEMPRKFEGFARMFLDGVRVKEAG